MSVGSILCIIAAILVILDIVFGFRGYPTTTANRPLYHGVLTAIGVLLVIIALLFFGVAPLVK